MSLGHPHAPAPSMLYPASDIDWRFNSYMTVYMIECHSPKSSHPLPLPLSPEAEVKLQATESTTEQETLSTSEILIHHNWQFISGKSSSDGPLCPLNSMTRLQTFLRE